ncbi:tRNA (adenosine(37)-N6)-dimethylallyltransferase MiaA [Blattabacterium cuenoti]|uniref:tRNA (adenosine(37)-N6)-dimethylallyltransferase MiaA n=1 Tax=Blattabacterium cuenoti TaxID=1653831 RepID=UPI00163CEE11|nr:tRNA (adenosine(37)-N6)-dimethylallyltransferase MiaA [Blattabacterium cuenoti]
MKKKFLISILGPTCIGKTDLSIFLAKKFQTEILSCDSRQFYKEIKIGTSMPDREQLFHVNHHFIGHLSIHQNYNAKLFEIDFLNKVRKLFYRYDMLIMVGGSSLYEKAATEGLSDIPEINKKIRDNLIFNFKKKGISFLKNEFKKFRTKEKYTIDINNPVRLIRFLEIIKSTGNPPSFFFKKKNENRYFFSVIKIGLIKSRDEIYYDINNRVEKMIKIGLLEEAKLYYKYRNLNSLQTIGYKEIYNNFFEKKNSLIDTIEKIKINTRKYAKKQLSWYRRDSNITWFHPKEKNKIISFIINKINNNKKVGNTGFEPVTSCL